MHLIKSMFFLLFLFTPYINSLGQNKNEIIENIREIVETIHMDTSLKSVTLQNEEFLQNMTDGGGELTAFYKGKNIYRIYQSIGISHGVEIMEFYYWKKNLIFIRERFNSYVYDDSLKTFDYTKTENTFKGLYYFKKGKLIDYSTTGHNRFENDSLDPEKILLKESEEKLQLIRQKMK